MKEVSELLDYITPFILTAGEYSARIQGGVGVHDAKDGATPFHHALSDADLTVQSCLEVALLARYPGVSFFSEEQNQSLNAKYFPKMANLEVQLDPIDGTRAYIAGRANYQLILTVHDHSEIVGAVCYMPRLNRCYTAVKGSGAFLRTKDDILSGKTGTPLDLTNIAGPVLVFNRPDLKQVLSKSFDVRDLLNEFDRGEAAYLSTDLIERRASAIVNAPAQAIDAGAIAFISKEGGAIVTDERGGTLSSFRDSPQRTLPFIVVATNKEVHGLVIEALMA